MSEPGSIEIDRSGTEPIIRIAQPCESFTVNKLRMYAEYLATVADEAAKPPPEPEVDELVAMFEATQARWMTWESATVELARAVVAAGYKREIAATETSGQTPWLLAGDRQLPSGLPPGGFSMSGGGQDSGLARFSVRPAASRTRLTCVCRYGTSAAMSSMSAPLFRASTIAATSSARALSNWSLARV